MGWPSSFCASDQGGAPSPWPPPWSTHARCKGLTLTRNYEIYCALWQRVLHYKYKDVCSKQGGSVWREAVAMEINPHCTRFRLLLRFQFGALHAYCQSCMKKSCRLYTS